MIDGILQGLRDRGIDIRVFGERFRVWCPEGALTEDDRACIAQYKDAIVRRLNNPPDVKDEPSPVPGSSGEGYPNAQTALPVPDALTCAGWQSRLYGTPRGSVAESYARECVWLANAKEVGNQRAVAERERNIRDILRSHGITPEFGFLYFEEEAPASASENDQADQMAS